MHAFNNDKLTLPAPDAALAGRPDPISTATHHFVSGRALEGDIPEGAEWVLFGMGCFWGAERLFWSLPGVWVTSVGYAGGVTPNPTYEEVCSGRTGHAEVVKVVFLPQQLPFGALLAHFWENHDPTQGMRQGNDIGTQYRSAILATSDAQLVAAQESARDYGARLARAGLGAITTEIGRAGPYYLAEEYHQQYLARNPQGYCGIRGTGVACAVGTGA